MLNARAYTALDLIHLETLVEGNESLACPGQK